MVVPANPTDENHIHRTLTTLNGYSLRFMIPLERIQRVHTWSWGWGAGRVSTKGRGIHGGGKCGTPTQVCSKSVQGYGIGNRGLSGLRIIVSSHNEEGKRNNPAWAHTHTSVQWMWCYSTSTSHAFLCRTLSWRKYLGLVTHSLYIYVLTGD